MSEHSFQVGDPGDETPERAVVDGAERTVYRVGTVMEELIKAQKEAEELRQQMAMLRAALLMARRWIVPPLPWWGRQEYAERRRAYEASREVVDAALAATEAGEGRDG